MASRLRLVAGGVASRDVGLELILGAGRRRVGVVEANVAICAALLHTGVITMPARILPDLEVLDALGLRGDVGVLRVHPALRRIGGRLRAGRRARRCACLEVLPALLQRRLRGLASLVAALE